MIDYRERFKSCGSRVEIAPDAYVERPEVMEVADHVTFGRGFHMIEGPALCRIGSHTTFHPNCFIQGTGARLIVNEHVDFYPGTYISLGGPDGFVEIGHRTHFAPGCVLYGHGGLTIGPYCNIAAHVVFATVGHDPLRRDQPMALAPPVSGPITLEEDVWIGANATITADVTIARGCIVGANAVLTKSTEPHGVYLGVPARRVRDR
jgi:acetyltransferase-like isoleucine patch superfamily enzyme